MAISGEKNIPRGTILEENRGMISLNNEIICLSRSQNGIEHFARDDDGQGLRRGDLTYAIAFKERVKQYEISLINPETGEEETQFYQSRFSPEEAEILESEYSRWLRPEHSVILFNEEFFKAPIEDLEKLAAILEL